MMMVRFIVLDNVRDELLTLFVGRQCAQCREPPCEIAQPTRIVPHASGDSESSEDGEDEEEHEGRVPANLATRAQIRSNRSASKK